MESCPTQVLLPPVGLATDKIIRDRYNARIGDIPAGQSQLITYALDLDVDVDVTRDESRESLAAAQLVKGVVITTDTVQRTSKYVIDNGTDVEKQVIVGQEIAADYELKTRDALDESTDELYRFAVTVKPESSSDFRVEEERKVESKQPLLSLDNATLRRYLVADTVPETMKEQLRQLLQLRCEIERITADIVAKNKQLQNLQAAQSRIRENMKVLDRESELYQQYVQWLGAQEETLKQLNKEVGTLTAKRQELERKMDSLFEESTEPEGQSPFSGKSESGGHVAG